MILAVTIIDWVFRIVILVVVVDVILSFFMSPFDPIRWWLDSFVNPMLAPIRRFLPVIGGLDFSPILLIILLQVLDSIIRYILLSL